GGVLTGVAAGVAAGAALWRPAAPPKRAFTASSASDAVRQAHQASTAGLNLADESTFADARRGFIARPSGKVQSASGETIWDFDSFAFVNGAAPPTVNPSLWRQARLNNEIGLFKVTEGIWQLRGFDLANMTLIEGRTGWIVVDTLTARETAATAIAFARQHLGNKPISAIIYTHSHADHFGGTLGLVSAEEVKARQIPIIAPAGFLEEATSENVLMGVAMGRRSTYMYGSRLPRNPQGLIDNGLGKAVAYGSIGILPPTRIIEQRQEALDVDGVRFIFHNVPESEAPSEFVFQIPSLKAFCGADLLSFTQHNLYTLRGTKVRDALKWADYIDQALSQTANADVVFNQHHWPVWGRERIRDFIVKQRDIYRYIHDQTVRLMNAGLTAPEIAETLELPRSLNEHLAVRGYYGTVRHNVRAVYQYYLGWYDAHPANLDALPPVDAGKRYVALAGGMDKLLAAAQSAYDRGDLRWAAELLKHAVYAEPGNKQAGELLAQTFDQLGYMAESTAWRNVYLSGAYELRQGAPTQGLSLDMLKDLLSHTPIDRFLERMAASIDGIRAAEMKAKINLVLSDLRESFVLELENGVLHHRKGDPAKDADATLTVTHPFFLRMMTGKAGAMDLLTSSEANIDGSTLVLGRFLMLVEKAPGIFPIVTR
ncbi:MAG TPA: alkyl sulfatase dimerization domain-containing protein, partial [Beijerinckiaceae bacterium]|nr:alkyl sulfatase dimerization domain-containing protein [Beijerinckiaceae bacterium]